MAYEASEIMFAAAMLFSQEELKKYSKDKDSLIKFMEVAKKKAASSVRFGNQSISQGFLSLMEPNDKALKDLSVGISSALGMKNKVSPNYRNAAPSVYMTGNVWPKEVEKFRVSAYGFNDYNSADVLFTYDNKMFYGISLKKKSQPKAPEPTLINKAFDTILNGPQFSKVKQELVDLRQQYFGNLVVESTQKGIIDKNDIKNFDTLKKTKEGLKELFEAKNRDKKKFDRTYIDTKGSAKLGYDYDNTSDPNTMRYFVNKKLSEPKNPLWSQFIKVMNSNSELFADSLINIILKTKLYKELEAKDLKKFKFGFFLVTGVGNVSKNSVTIGSAQVLSLETTLCGLTRIDLKYANKPYLIELNESKKGSSDAAKIFMQLKRGNLVLLDLELRYKGAFTSQPQFQGTLNTQFKDLLKDECGI